MTPKYTWIHQMALSSLADAQRALYTLGVTLRDLGWDRANGPVQEVRVMLEQLETIRERARRAAPLGGKKSTVGVEQVDVE